MTIKNAGPLYALGSTDAEHERLMRQARWLTVHTERCFRDAGIGLEQRVLDIGSGVGDVALILARLVGPTGDVLGVEQDTRSIVRARNRVVEAGFRNVSFIQSDVSQFVTDKLFDAVVGRYILFFVPDPISLLRSLFQLVRPGGVLAFQEPDWRSFIERAQAFALWAAGATLMVETFERSGTNTNLGPEFLRVFRKAGLPEPTTCTDVLVGAEEWMPDVLQSLYTRITQLTLNIEPLGD
jgi:ubiquinone/menaquinone biosynthesis C-methylase UbiE